MYLSKTVHWVEPNTWSGSLLELIRHILGEYCPSLTPSCHISQSGITHWDSKHWASALLCQLQLALQACLLFGTCHLIPYRNYVNNQTIF